MKLLELLIAFILATGLIAFLFHFLIQVESPSAFEDTYALYTRLSQILPEINDEVYLEGDDLVFNFDNGIDDDPQYSSLVHAKLYLDNSSLILSIQPDREEILAKEIHTLHFSLLDQQEDELPSRIEVQVNDTAHTYPLIASGKPIQYHF